MMEFSADRFVDLKLVYNGPKIKFGWLLRVKYEDPEVLVEAMKYMATYVSDSPVALIPLWENRLEALGLDFEFKFLMPKWHYIYWCSKAALWASRYTFKHRPIEEYFILNNITKLTNND